MQIYQFDDGDVVAAQTSILIVSKVGLEADIFDIGQNQPALYGLISIVLAVGAGWSAGLIFKKIRDKGTTMSEADLSAEHEHERVFLVVVDDSEELNNALRFACRRAQHTSGRVALLYVIEPIEFQHWVGVGRMMEEEAREEAEQRLQTMAAGVFQQTGMMPIMHIREGKARRRSGQAYGRRAQHFVVGPRHSNRRRQSRPNHYAYPHQYLERPNSRPDDIGARPADG